MRRIKSIDLKNAPKYLDKTSVINEMVFGIMIIYLIGARAVMPQSTFYVKSLEGDFATKTLKGKKKVTCQTVKEIVGSKTILPNTLSFKRKKRLACTLLHKNYLKTYRPQGIIFQTKQKPDYFFPFDLVVLGATDDIVVQYYRIKNNLHKYYNQGLIRGFEKFIFRDFNKMLKQMPSPKDALRKVNAFRKANGYAALSKSKERLVQYNEAIFHRQVRIKPVAIFGYCKKAGRVAKKAGLPCYRNAREFFSKVTQNRKK